MDALFMTPDSVNQEGLNASIFDAEWGAERETVHSLSEHLSLVDV